MDSPRVPTELSELIIDRVRDSALPWWGRLKFVFGTQSYRLGTADHVGRDLHTLRACALTCSAWLPRARVNLYHTVVFDDPHDVELFVRAIQVADSSSTRHCLADLVRELVVEFAGGYIPFAQGTLLRKLRSLRTVVFPLLRVDSHSAGWHYPSPRHHVLVAQFNSLTELVFDLNLGDYRMVVYAFRVVWAVRGLERLTLMFSGHPPAFTNAQVQPLRALQRPWSCSKLKTLAATGPFLQKAMDVLHPRPFGTAVERVAIYLDSPISRQCVDGRGY
ncbi:hypothetical protein L226DRAFT_540215 [Lentinus tigrinus ALCF2SS1-7]|uniref:F-box domain-containing protein n=1 Tax=Lentinus tigrinus ALCF2SS1-6 TaxID=1328759 RepID=A0A5C2S6P2_9APHY|nr:hypothetical protein L227DRAFT_576801 [Lentinus tigrinus ALCF2SS1-6]RPD68908.1 hypothetical protein L226DRAFT_540215 [Lentinus tigrinus ALCF2SS1-7]